MSSSFYYSFLRPIPPGVSSDSVKSLLHEPSNIIKLSPIVLEYHEVSDSHDSRPQPPNSRLYAVTDFVSYLPFGLYTGTVTVNVEFATQEDGMLVTRHAPLGLVFRERWIVQERGLSGAATEQVGGTAKAESELALRVEMTGNYLTLLLFKGMMQKNHKAYLDEMISTMEGTKKT